MKLHNEHACEVEVSMVGLFAGYNVQHRALMHIVMKAWTPKLHIQLSIGRWERMPCVQADKINLKQRMLEIKHFVMHEYFVITYLLIWLCSLQKPNHKNVRSGSIKTELQFSKNKLLLNRKIHSTHKNIIVRTKLNLIQVQIKTGSSNKQIMNKTSNILELINRREKTPYPVELDRL